MAHGAQLMSAEVIAKPLVADEMFALASWKNCARATHNQSRAALSCSPKGLALLNLLQHPVSLWELL